MNSVVRFAFEQEDALFPLSARVLRLLQNSAEAEGLLYDLQFLGRERIILRKTLVKANECPQSKGLLLASYLPGMRQRFILQCNPICVAWLKRTLPRLLGRENIYYVYGDIPYQE